MFRREKESTALVPSRRSGIPEPAFVVDWRGRVNLTQTTAVIEAHTSLLRALADNVRARTELESAFANYERQQALIEYLGTLSPQERAYYEASLRSGR